MKLLIENDKEKFSEYVEKYQSNIFPFLESFTKEINRINSSKNEITQTELSIMRYAIFLQWPIRKLEYSYMIKSCENFLVSGMKTLDVGCGVTPVARWFASKGCHAYGIDVDENTIKYLQNSKSYLHDPKINFSCQDMTSLNFNDNTFDLVTSISVLEHLRHPSDSKAISEMLRVLRPGGLLVMTVDYEPMKEDFTYRKINKPYNNITLEKTILQPFSNYVEDNDIRSQVSSEEIKKFWELHWWPESLYDKNLGRNYVSVGLNLRKIDENFKKLTFDFHEEEIKSKIIECYKKILKREPDEDGLEHHYQLIIAGKITVEELSTILEMSQEYKNLEKLYAGYAFTTEEFGLYLDPLDAVLSKTVAFTGSWQPDETKFFKNIVSSGMTIIDVGANIGYFTMLFSKLTGPTGRVIAFEPNPRSYSILEKNIRSSSSQNVILVKKAVSDYSGTTKLFLSQCNPTDNRIFNSSIYETDDDRETIDVQVMTLDEYVQDMKVDILKIDVQGAEMMVINGALQTIMNNRDLQIIVEFWPIGLSSNGIKPMQFLKNLENLGFYIYDLNGSQPIQTTVTELCSKYTDKSFTDLYCIRKKI